MPRKKKQYLQLKIQLRDEHPLVWRRVVVPYQFTLEQLHAVLQIAFGWRTYHLYQFWATRNKKTLYVPDFDGYSDAVQKLIQDIKAGPLLEKSNLIYEYDFGESWEHLIHLEKILEPADIEGSQAPFCLAGRGAAKREDSRGEEDNDAAPFDQAANNDRLHAVFPTDTAMPDDYRYGQKPQSRQPNRRTAKSKKQTLTDSELHDAVNGLLVEADNTTLRNADALAADFRQGRLSIAQQAYVAQRIIDDMMLLYYIDDHQTREVYVRMSVGEVVRSMLVQDVARSFLTDNQLAVLFNQIVTAVIEEHNVSYFINQFNGRGSALSTLATAVQHPAFPEKLAKRIGTTVLRLIINVNGPFNSNETESIAFIFYVLAARRVLTPKELIGQMQSIDGILNQRANEAELANIYPLIHQRAWIGVLALANVMFESAYTYRPVWNYIHGQLQQWVAAVGVNPKAML